MTEHDQAVQAAFGLLRDVVADLQFRDRKTLIQGVKPGLQVKTGGEFNEQSLGFETFGEFVRAAAAAGVVRLTKDRNGWALSLPGRTDQIRAETRPRIHHDLWRAFTDWSQDHRYAWDRDRRVVATLPAGVQDEPPIPGNLVLIPPASHQEQVGWAREFLDAQKGSRVAEALQGMLGDGDDAFERFSLLIRSEPRLEGEWRGERRRRIADAIRRWAQEHDLDVDPYMTAEVVVPTTAAEDAAGEDPAERLRAAVKRAVDRMSAAELRELRLPVGSLEGSGL